MKSIATVFILTMLMAANLNAQVVTIFSPAPGKEVVYGQKVDWFVLAIAGLDSIAGYRARTIDLQIQEVTGLPAGILNSQSIYGTVYIPDDITTGTHRFLDVGVTFHGFGTTTMTLDVLVLGPDTTPPTYAGDEGILSAEYTYLDDVLNISVAWNEAMDNGSDASEIVYNVYCSGAMANLFESDPVSTSTGVLETYLVPKQLDVPNYLGVRAVDKAGNLELNTNIVLLSPFQVTSSFHWSRFE